MSVASGPVCFSLHNIIWLGCPCARLVLPVLPPLPTGSAPSVLSPCACVRAPCVWCAAPQLAPGFGPAPPANPLKVRLPRQAGCPGACNPHPFMRSRSDRAPACTGRADAMPHIPVHMAPPVAAGLLALPQPLNKEKFGCSPVCSALSRRHFILKSSCITATGSVHGRTRLRQPRYTVCEGPAAHLPAGALLKTAPWYAL